MNSSRKLNEMTTSSKQAKKPWVSHHQRRGRFWALIMWLCSAGVQTIRMVPIRSILLRWSIWQTSTSRKRGNRTRSFMNLFVSSFAYFIEDYFSRHLIDFGARSAQATLAVLTLPLAGMTKMFSSSLFWVPEVRRTACIQPGLRVYQV